LTGSGTIFAYQTSKTSTVLTRSELALDSYLTFSYDQISSTAQNLLEFADASSKLWLYGGTLHTTATGLTLTKGTLMVEADSCIGSKASANPITFGDNSSSANDFACSIAGGAVLKLNQGALS